MNRKRGRRLTPEDISKLQVKIFVVCVFSLLFLISQIINLYDSSFMDDTLMKAGTVLWISLSVGYAVSRNKEEALYILLGATVLAVVLIANLMAIGKGLPEYILTAKISNVFGWLLIFLTSTIAFVNSWKMLPGPRRSYTIAWLITPGVKP